MLPSVCLPLRMRRYVQKSKLDYFSPDSNVICWDAKGDGTYTFAVEKTGDAEDDAIWLVDGYGYTGSEDLTGKVTEPDEDLDSDMLVGGALSEESYHGTLDGNLFFLLRRK